MWSSVWPMAASEIRIPMHGSTTKLAIQTTITHKGPVTGGPGSACSPDRFWVGLADADASCTLPLNLTVVPLARNRGRSSAHELACIRRCIHMGHPLSEVNDFCGDQVDDLTNDDAVDLTVSKANADSRRRGYA